MAETNILPVDFTGMDSWTPSSGGLGSDLLTHDGLFQVRFADAEPCIAEKSRNSQFRFALIVEDADNKGRRIHTWVPYSGIDKNGKSNKERLWSVLASAGITADKRAMLAAQGSGAAEDVARIFLKDGGKIGYVEIEAELRESRWSSRVSFFVSKERYEADKALGVHRKPLPLGAARGAVETHATSAPPAAPSSDNGAKPAGAPASSGSSRTALDLL